MNALIIIFYKIAAFFTRVPKKTREKDASFIASMAKNSLPPDGTFINRQSDFSGFPFGSGNIGDNGCGPIAVYNALLALRKKDINSDFVSDISFTSVIDYFEKKGATLRGKFGTSPSSIRKYLSLKGFSTKICMSKSPDVVNAFSCDYSVFISVFYNNGRTIKDGLHFICSVKNKVDDSKYSFTTFNPKNSADTLFDALNMCSNKRIRNVYTIGIY